MIILSKLSLIAALITAVVALIVEIRGNILSIKDDDDERWKS